MDARDNLMIICERYALSDTDEEEAAVIVNETRKEFLSIDSKVLDDGKNWWSCVLKQHEDGLM